MNCCCEIGSRPEEGAMIILARTNQPITSGRYRDVIGTMTCDTCCLDVIGMLHARVKTMTCDTCCEYFRIWVIR